MAGYIWDKDGKNIKDGFYLLKKSLSEKEILCYVIKKDGNLTAYFPDDDNPKSILSGKIIGQLISPWNLRKCKDLESYAKTKEAELAELRQFINNHSKASKLERIEK